MGMGGSCPLGLGGKSGTLPSAYSISGLLKSQFDLSLLVVTTANPFCSSSIHVTSQPPRSLTGA